MTKVLIPSPLRPYTQAREVEAHGTTLSEILTDLDRHFPGLKFRIVDEQGKMRPHMRFFVNGVQVFDVDHPLGPEADVQLVQALSGG